MLECLSYIKNNQIRCDPPGIVLSRPELQSSTSFCLSLVIFTLLQIFPFFISFVKADSATEPAPIRIGITPVILMHQVQLLHQWESYLEARLEQRVEFIQQDTYGKITTQLLKGELEFGWLCGYPYIQHQSILDLIAVPLFQSKPFYQSYLIVSNSDKKTNSLLDLKDTVFAYSDPDSNSGFLYAQFQLLKANINPKTFFRTSFFTWQHRNTVEAVAVGLAQAGTVDSYIWETLKKQGHPLIRKTRVVHKSDDFAFPPFVAAKNISNRLKNKLQQILLSMDKDAEGLHLLEILNLDGFIRGEIHLYDDIRRMHQFIENRRYAAS